MANEELEEFKKIGDGLWVIKSENIKVFPCISRGNDVNDPYAVLNTEYNLTHLAASGIDDSKSYFVENNPDGNPRSIKCFIDGYYFEFEHATNPTVDVGDSVDYKYLSILKTGNSKEAVLSNVSANISGVEIQNTTSLDTDGYFYGLLFSNSRPTTMSATLWISDNFVTDYTKIRSAVKNTDDTNRAISGHITDNGLTTEIDQNTKIIAGKTLTIGNNTTMTDGSININTAEDAITTTGNITASKLTLGNEASLTSNTTETVYTDRLQVGKNNYEVQLNTVFSVGKDVFTINPRYGYEEMGSIGIPLVQLKSYSNTDEARLQIGTEDKLDNIILRSDGLINASTLKLGIGQSVTGFLDVRHVTKNILSAGKTGSDTLPYVRLGAISTRADNIAGPINATLCGDLSIYNDSQPGKSVVELKYDNTNKSGIINLYKSTETDAVITLDANTKTIKATTFDGIATAAKNNFKDSNWGALYVGSNAATGAQPVYVNNGAITAITSPIKVDYGGTGVNSLTGFTSDIETTKTITADSGLVIKENNTEVGRITGFTNGASQVGKYVKILNDDNFDGSGKRVMYRFGQKLQLFNTALTNKPYNEATYGDNLISLDGLSGEITAVSFNATSDIRKKENIKDYRCEKSILDLPVKKFDFINGPKNQIGCIAQDLREICPEIVQEDEDGYLSIKESKIVYLLLQEVKELKEEINKIKKG